MALAGEWMGAEKSDKICYTPSVKCQACVLSNSLFAQWSTCSFRSYVFRHTSLKLLQTAFILSSAYLTPLSIIKSPPSSKISFLPHEQQSKINLYFMSSLRIKQILKVRLTKLRLNFASVRAASTNELCYSSISPDTLFTLNFRGVRPALRLATTRSAMITCSFDSR